MPSRKVCAQICPECPFRRKSLPGWLGESSGDPWDFLVSFGHGELPLSCHMQVDWEKPDAKERAEEAPICRGSLTMLGNSLKLPKDPELSELVRSVPSDHSTVFSNPNEFCLHHHYDEIMRRMGVPKPTEVKHTE